MNFIIFKDEIYRKYLNKKLFIIYFIKFFQLRFIIKKGFNNFKFYFNK